MSDLLQGSVLKHLYRLTLPSIAGIVAIMVFNITDTWFVSKLGTEELAAIGFSFPVVMVVGSLAIGFSTGAASIITRAIGSGNRSLARRTVADGLFLTIAGTVVVALVGYFSTREIFTLLGAEGRVLDLVQEYMQIWFLGAVFAILPPVSDGCLRASGDMMRPLLVMCVCALINVILDPILIFGWGPIPAMEMKGAAIATLIARCLATVASLCFLHFHHRLIDWKRPELSDLFESWRQIIRLGIPSALSQALTPVAQSIFIKLAAAAGGVHAVAAVATGTRIEAFFLIFAYAYNIALVPFAGQNFGAGAFGRVHATRSASNRFALLYAGVCLLVLLPLARPLSACFSEHPNVISMSATYLLIVTLGHAGLHCSMWMSQMLNIIGLPKTALVLTLSRVLLFGLPLCILGGTLYGFTGLVIGIAVGNLFAGVFAYWQSGKRLMQEAPVEG